MDIVKLPFDRYDQIVFFDIETTGFNALNDDIVELSAIAVTKEGAQEPVHEYVKMRSGNQLPESQEKFLGIKNDYLKEHGVDEHIVLTKLFSLLKNKKALIVTYNAKFALMFLVQAVNRYSEASEWSELLNTFDVLDLMKTKSIDAGAFEDYKNTRKVISDILKERKKDQNEMMICTNDFAFFLKLCEAGFDTAVNGFNECLKMK